MARDIRTREPYRVPKRVFELGFGGFTAGAQITTMSAALDERNRVAGMYWVYGQRIRRERETEVAVVEVQIESRFECKSEITVRVSLINEVK